ncbi:MAG TPA: arylsulfotransferase family protein [Solirubrobacteraceae bacterium]|nr:arylsulfotransferase family protein [Solirubrobacteraceae bacterium]
MWGEANRGWRTRLCWAMGLALALAALAVPTQWAVARPPRQAARAAATALQAPLHVMPFPGTPDASPESQIIFSSLHPSDIRSVIVTGSRSGLHPGHSSELPDQAGTAFVPTHPFTPGETVVVQAQLRSALAGTASGAPGARTLNFSFTVGVPAPVTSSAARAARAAASASGPLVNFHSRPDLHPPPLAATANPDHASGEIFLTAQAGGDGSSQVGPMILNSRGKLVWFRPVTRRTPYNLQVQRYGGHPVLTWWEGQFLGRGMDVIVNQSYRRVGVVRGAEHYFPDLHEFQITPAGTALVDSYSVVQANLSSLGGPSNGRVTDCIIQELDIRTGKLLWEWHALGHVPLADSYAGGANGSAPYDFFHLNAIQQLPGGDFLISSRNTWSVYKIDGKTGRIVWRLGGKHSDFRMGPGTNFEWQHDARLNGDQLTLFDDGAWPQEESQSSAKVLRIDQSKRTAVLLRRYTHSPPLLAFKGGSMQILPNGNVFVGWGGAPDFSEYTPAGRQVFNGSVPIYMNSYRAFRFPWTGQAPNHPALALTPSKKGLTWLYVSWNGATQVARWRVLGGSSAHTLTALKTRPWSGFETAIALPGAPHFLAVQALDSRGRVLGRSAVAARPA